VKRNRHQRLELVALGGTIACVETEVGLKPGLCAGELLGHVTLPAGVAVEPIDLLERTIVAPRDWQAVATYLFEHRDACDGFVVTLGTDTLAYLGAALSVMLRQPAKPVVLTGAMRPIGFRHSDARRNLRDAVAVARSRVPGVFVVFAGLVMDARRASKVRSGGPRAFESIGAPPLARVRAGRIAWHAARPRVRGTPALDTRLETDVGLVVLTPQTTPRTIAREKSRRGLVVEGYGDGNVPNDLVPALARCAREGALVLASQCAYGAALHRYEGGAAVIRAGALSAGDMTTEMAMVKLMAALGRAPSLAEARRLFREEL
jgi:L-asparaginase